MKYLAFIGVGLAMVAGLEGSGRQVPKRQILGINLNMTENEAHARLKTIGTLERTEEKRQEVWKVRDPSFSHIIIGFGKDEKLRYVTAVAREDKKAKRVTYSAIGDLKEARQVGNPKVMMFDYRWALPAAKDEPEMLVIALGRDPKFLTTYSLKRLGPRSRREGTGLELFRIFAGSSVAAAVSAARKRNAPCPLKRYITTDGNIASKLPATAGKAACAPQKSVAIPLPGNTSLPRLSLLVRAMPFRILISPD